VGAFYANVTVFDADPASVARSCRRPAYLVSDAEVTVVFAEADDDGSGLADGQLSAALKGLTLSVLVHDSDLLGVMVHRDGTLILEGCVPDPSAYFETDAEAPPSLTGAAIVDALGRGSADAIDAALTDPEAPAEERHEALLRALSLPTWSVDFGYRYLHDNPDTFTGPTPVHLT
jgi:hypothetical protein